MPRLNLLAGTAAAAILFGAGGAIAADMPVYYEPEPAFGGWYLRGDIGISNQRAKSIYNPAWDLDADVASVSLVDQDFDASWFIGLGVGYQFNEWFRADVTGEYRGKSDFRATDLIDLTSEVGSVNVINDYITDKSEWTFLANVYWDIGTWHSVTPFLGVGLGASYNRIGDLTDTNLMDPTSSATCAANGCAEANGQWDLAWALHAGLSFAISPKMVVELAYRYLHLGDAESGDVIGNDGTNDYVNPLQFDNLHSHDVKIGLRYTLN